MPATSAPSIRPTDLGRKLGEGGEGVVHALNTRPREVAKLYHTPLTGEAADKLRAMIGLDIGPLADQAAWPTALLEGAGGAIEGFVMPKADEPFDIHEIYTPGDRLKRLPEADWRFLVHVARNLCVAFAAAHAAGLVIGDVNHGSVRVGSNGQVRLIDCDSMQLTANGTTYRCKVGIDLFTPPELQGVRLNEVDRTADHDRFGLAVLIFQLLMMGRHPFAGAPNRRTAPAGLGAAIAAGAYAYRQPPGLLKPPHAAPAVTLLGDEVAGLFEQAFKPVSRGASWARPDARAWHTALGRLSETLVTCPRAPVHAFRRDLGTCPWCTFDEAGILFFVSRKARAVSDGKRFDPKALTRTWAPIKERCKQLQVWLDTAELDHPGGVGGPRANFHAMGRGGMFTRGPISVASTAHRTALPVTPRAWLRPYGRRVRIGSSVAAAGAGLAGFFAAPAFYAGIPVAGIAALILLAVPRGPIREQLEIAERQLTDLPPTLSRNQIVEARQLMHDAKRLEREAAQARKKVADLEYDPRKGAHETQLKAHLSRFPLRPDSVAGIGPAHLAQLQSFGIASAADIDAKAIFAIPGFGPKKTQDLVAWRKRHEATFRFDPSLTRKDRIQIAQARARQRAPIRDYYRALSELITAGERLEAVYRVVEARYEALEARRATLNQTIARSKAELDALAGRKP